ncbi:DNA/RNA nuclease SfsA [Archaeoglobus veneficus]|uniref:Sugar fermentation stimulation protein homolog n=1 Tax=Archaeoglobus veneficus (strain DSM 11195 / SNP6) TaxID=693661 RepID=F2KPT4_ARCVS|nr:DNA/RNA nuclease SfsA [Archaeoglobus veneficus]AEA46441.1 Sugar fermentation stimulation protein A [Archaeoglobus veneficus SNP6]
MSISGLIDGNFIRRDNRFLVTVEINGRPVKAHLKDPGRLKELLVEGNRVLLKERDGKNRKTRYDVIAIYAGVPVIVNSGLHSALAEKIIPQIFRCGIAKREFTFLGSRIDFLLDCHALLEVKGCTLVKDSIAYFPDAPTERGLKHILTLIKAMEMSYSSKILFLVTRPDARVLKPNRETHPEFADALNEAMNKGVEVRAVLLELVLKGHEAEIVLKGEIPVKPG